MTIVYTKHQTFRVKYFLSFWLKRKLFNWLKQQIQQIPTAVLESLATNSRLHQQLHCFPTFLRMTSASGATKFTLFTLFTW